MGEFPNQRNNLEPSKLEKLRAASAKVKMVRASNDKAFLRVAILLGIAALGLAVLKLTTLERTSPRFREPRVLVKTVDDLVASKPGERRVLVIEGVDFAFRYCPPGEFEMGTDEEFRSNNRHKVTLTQGFWLMETELTRGQWSAIMKTRVPGDKERPMESLSWNECQEFVDKINAVRNLVSERWTFSLPTEAQWEYACRAGTTGDHYGELDKIAWYCKNEGRRTRRVGLKKPNPWGLYDMIGNVDEWCRDWSREGSFREEDATDPTGPTEGKTRIYRGGDAGALREFCAAHFRAVAEPDFKLGHKGFRLALRNPTVKSPSIAEKYYLEARASQDNIESRAKIDRAIEFEPNNREYLALRDEIYKRSGLPIPKVVQVSDEPEAGEVMTLNLPDPTKKRTLELRFRHCPSGSFTMDEESEILRRLVDEGERKRGIKLEVGNGKVEVPFLPGFWILETEVSQDVWIAVMGNNPSFHQGEDYPVENISWDDCRKFVGQLNSTDCAPSGYCFSLPTEAQWEYACRAGSSSAFWWGDDPDPAKIRCVEAKPTRTDFIQTSAGKFGPEMLSDPVRSFGSNPWGLYHMNGNVAEFCSDNAFPSQERESNSNDERIARGGFYLLPPELCHYAYRLRVPNDPAKNKAPFVGFRIVLVPETF
ncbi:MAG: SUMF1/EgtB/PvdO family nonheme iron enzyme [Thermoguttaceae bacterium]|nr:SUMF1/EgtB/PvdO family nonheme iron enzyme [Thermoguttaceae bacterium]